MAPESPGNLIALDLEWNNSRLECQVDRYDSGNNFLYVSWNAIECPEHYVPISGGVAYVWVPQGYVHRRYRARVNDIDDRFEWIDVAQAPSGAMLILTLPLSYVFVPPSDNASDQSPVDFKSTEDGRMALYWWLQPGRFTALWHMVYRESANIDAECQRLKREARRRNPPDVSPVHIDRPPEEVNVPSHQPPVINEPPELHLVIQVRDQATLIMGHQEQVNLSRKVKNVRQEKVIKIGKEATVSAPIIIADTIENSFNTLMESRVNDDIKQLLEELLKEVNEVNKKAPKDKSDEAEAMARDAESLVKEVASSKPRRRWYEVSLEGLKQAAINIGEIADPVLNIVTKLMPLLLPLAA